MINEKYAHAYCRDDISKIENYDKAIADTTQTWVIHHRLELTLDGEFALTAAQLRMHDMYYNRPYYELIFLTKAEHRRMHMKNITDDTRKRMSEAKKGRTSPMKGKHLTDETRRKLSEAHKGKQSWNKGTCNIYSDETKKKMSKAHKNISDETRRKMSEAQKGKQRSEETRRKISEAMKRRCAAKD